MHLSTRTAAVALTGALALSLAAPAVGATTAATPSAAPPAVSRAALLPTTISGFSTRAVAANQGSTFPVTARVSGPGRRAVVVQRLAGKRWVNVVTAKTTARGALSLKVKATVAGKVLYRLVVPRVGLFAAKVSATKLVVVKKLELKYVPGLIAGTFTGTQYMGAKSPTSKPFLTWRGSAEFSKVTRAGNTYSYTLTKLAVDWTIDTVEGDCAYKGAGTFTLADAEVNGIEAMYEPWGPFEPGRYSLDVVLKRGVPRFPYSVTCPYQDPYNGTFYNEFRAAELLRVGRSGVLAPNATVVGGLPRSLDGITFAGSIAANVDDASGDNTWAFTGDLGLSVPRY